MLSRTELKLIFQYLVAGAVAYAMLWAFQWGAPKLVVQYPSLERYQNLAFILVIVVVGGCLWWSRRWYKGHARDEDLERVRFTEVSIVAAIAPLFILFRDALLLQGSSVFSVQVSAQVLILLVATHALQRSLTMVYRGLVIGQTYDSWAMVRSALFLYAPVGLYFAALYSVIPASVMDGDKVYAARPLDFIYFSFTTLSTTGYGDWHPARDWTKIVTIVESFMGGLSWLEMHPSASRGALIRVVQATQDRHPANQSRLLPDLLW